MATSTLRPGLPTEYYAPDFRIEVEGQELDPVSKGDLLEVKVVMDVDNMSSAQLTFNNWDDSAFALKYSDTKTFDLGNRVVVQLGYAGEVLSMLRGQISTLTPDFPDSGEPTLEVNVLDGMLKLRDSHPGEGEIKKYVDMTDSQIATQVATRNGMQVEVTDDGPRHELVVQKNQDDATFLMERARRIDYECFVLTDPDTGKDTLHFVEPTDARGSGGARVYAFAWGRSEQPGEGGALPSLISFAPTLTMSRQVGSVTVRGWDPRTKQAIVSTATPSDLPGSGGSGTSGPHAAEEALGGKEEVVVDAPVTSADEARRLAVALLRERAYEFVTGTGRVIGLSDLRPGDNVDLTGLGKRFSGRYYVKRVEHTLGDSGYQCDFEVRRVFDGGVS